MGEIERVDHASPERRSGGEVARRDVTFAGADVEYASLDFTPEEAWQLLSGGMREWAERHAGDQIIDPHARAKTIYWYCMVSRGQASGPDGASVAATYDLVMFGKRGLVVSDGSTDDFVDHPGATRWRNRRIALAVDPAGIRHDHHREAPANVGVGAGVGASGDALAAVLSPDLIDSDEPIGLGHLPHATQRFLFEPFTGQRSRATNSWVYAHRQWSGSEVRERLWAYLFNARWMGFAFTERWAPARRGRRAQRVADKALRTVPWRVCAWVAPVLRDGGRGPGA